MLEYEIYKNKVGMIPEDRLQDFKEILRENCFTNGECLDWTGKLFSGYGKFRFLKQEWAAHRVSYMVNKGKIPEGLYICHKCNNKKCINHEHLYAGTAKENSRDLMNTKEYPDIIKKNVKIRKENKENRIKKFEIFKSSFLTIEEFASILHVHPNTVLNGIKNGYYQSLRTGIGARSSYRIPSSEISRVTEFNLNEVLEKIIKQRNK